MAQAHCKGIGIDVSSEVGVGTTFTLYLPEVCVDGSVERTAEEPTKPS